VVFLARVMVLSCKTKKERTMIPPRVGINYLSHQEIGVRWMLSQEADEKKSKGGILGDDMGLGKTVQSIAFMGWLKDQAESRYNVYSHHYPPHHHVC
jgi:SNF2 family DNA or RNA helicase